MLAIFLLINLMLHSGVEASLTGNVYQVNLPDSEYFMNDDTKNCYVAGTNHIIGFLCPDTKKVFYHKKNDFLYNQHLDTTGKGSIY